MVEFIGISLRGPIRRPMPPSDGLLKESAPSPSIGMTVTDKISTPIRRYPSWLKIALREENTHATPN